ncbi:hypothetical protein ACMAZF_07060 [Psychrobium sp. nBUS_13]|uniref:hypothetical protein n=1 Tax=Psychrobium sp. nBUS_13 TaxID=3395319 RepID=UPI003EC14F5C
MFKKLLYYFVFSGNKWLRDYEALSLQQFASSLTAKQQKRLNLQFNYYNIAQRSDDGKIVQFFNTIDQNRKNIDIKARLDESKGEKKVHINLLSENGEKVIGKIFIL